MNAVGVKGALFDYRKEVIDADKNLVRNSVVMALINPSFGDRCLSMGTAAVFSFIVSMKIGAKFIDDTSVKIGGKIDSAYKKAEDSYIRFSNAIINAMKYK